MFVRSIAAAALAACAAGATQAATYDYQFTSTISSASTPGIAAGDAFTLDMYLNNGGTTNASQSWNGNQVTGFAIHAGSYSATYSTPFEPGAYFDFQTDATGKVTLAEFYGTDPSSTNSDNFTPSFTGDYVFGDASFNDSLYRNNTVTAGGFTSVANWSLVSSVPEPTQLALMASALALFGLARRRQRG